MVNNLLKNIIDFKHDLTTYRIGLLQAKVYRILKQHTSRVLEPYGLSTVEWAILGMLFDRVEGMNVVDMARELGVKATFVTFLTNKLAESGFIKKISDSADKRAKLLLLTAEGKDLVRRLEKLLRTATRPLLKGVSLKALLGYRSVLKAIEKNSSN